MASEQERQVLAEQQQASRQQGQRVLPGFQERAWRREQRERAC